MKIKFHRYLVYGKIVHFVHLSLHFQLVTQKLRKFLFKFLNEKININLFEYWATIVIFVHSFQFDRVKDLYQNVLQETYKWKVRHHTQTEITLEDLFLKLVHSIIPEWAALFLLLFSYYIKLDTSVIPIGIVWIYGAWLVIFRRCHFLVPYTYEIRELYG